MKRLTLLVLCALACPAAAEINMADSIEWQTIDADLVVRGFVQSVKRTGDRWDVTFKITESIKGGAKQALQLRVDRDPAGWQKDQTDLLLFLDKDKAQALQLRPAHGDSHSAFELGKHRAFTTTFAVLDKPTDVLAAVRAMALATASGSVRIDVPWDTPAMKALWGGSAVFMTVPIDAALEQRALAWIATQSVNEREQGVRVLANFRSKANIARLTALLADAGSAQITETGKPVMKRYLVRVAAHEVLASWGVDHKTPVLEERLRK